MAASCRAATDLHGKWLPDALLHTARDPAPPKEAISDDAEHLAEAEELIAAV